MVVIVWYLVGSRDRMVFGRKVVVVIVWYLVDSRGRDRMVLVDSRGRDRMVFGRQLWS